MIPRAYITQWRAKAPWVSDNQVEHDLILTRLLVELFSNDIISANLRLRGGTALYKLFFTDNVRFSEDIDLVQKEPGPIGSCMDVIRDICYPILGETVHWKQSKGRVTMQYKANSEIAPIVPMKFKIEINTREHYALFGSENCRFGMDSRWFSGEAQIKTFTINELLGTKLRALYQRKKGRDLFDVWYAISSGDIETDSEMIIEAFRFYLKKQGVTISQKEYKENLESKITDSQFIDDIQGLLNLNIQYNPEIAGNLLIDRLINNL